MVDDRSSDWLLETSTRHHWRSPVEAVSWGSWHRVLGRAMPPQVRLPSKRTNKWYTEMTSSSLKHPTSRWNRLRKLRRTTGVLGWPFTAKLHGWASPLSSPLQTHLHHAIDDSTFCWEWVTFQMFSGTRCFYAWSVHCSFPSVSQS